MRAFHLRAYSLLSPLITAYFTLKFQAMAKLLTTNFDDLTPGGTFQLSWVEGGGIVLSLHALEDGITSDDYQIFIFVRKGETYNDTDPGITYSRGWNVPQNLRLNSQCQFNLKQKSTDKVFTYPAQNNFVITKDSTSLKSPAPTLLKTCSPSTSTDNCLPPITSEQPGSVIAATTKPASTSPATSSLSSSSILLPPSNSVSAAPVVASITPVQGPSPIIAIGVGVGIGVVALLGLGFLLLRYRKNKVKPFRADTPPPLVITRPPNSPLPTYQDPKLFPNNQGAPSYMDTSSTDKPAALSIYGSLELNNITGGGTIKGSVKRPSQMMGHELTPVYGRGRNSREAGYGGSESEMSAYESIYSQPEDENFDARRDTSFGGFI
ncbi:hypothetical protein HYALB_00013089 [Hymenoscyphus albidus]|uniref:Uncharacterized protein n=1 Tax=Hymenoscyphus albidus TaxID=595503 RepID=A0A9N9LSN3_9HELO|nr:hypothetical protein HYALB_00013089 [Hymenoscyphus albidus]